LDFYFRLTVDSTAVVGRIGNRKSKFENRPVMLPESPIFFDPAQKTMGWLFLKTPGSKIQEQAAGAGGSKHLSLDI
jgi:hypothetical protein